MINHRLTRLFCLSAGVLIAAPLQAQQAAAPRPPTTTPSTAPATPATAPAAQTFSQQQLDQLLAPIALYPDSLLSQVLMASTYPIEVVQADRWVKANPPALTGDALATALDQQRWDPSVKSLVNFPQVLAMMSDKLDWTTQLGDAFINNQQSVMNTVQSLRAKAQAAGTLQTTPQQTVKVDEAGGPPVVVIEQADPNVVYVPVYDPNIVYGTWWYPDYPPYYYYPPNYVHSTTIWFGVGYPCGVPWGFAWGYCDWRQRAIDIDFNRHERFNPRIDRNRYRDDWNRRNPPAPGTRDHGQLWQHDPVHRRGMWYDDARNRGYNFGGGNGNGNGFYNGGSSGNGSYTGGSSGNGNGGANGQGGYVGPRPEDRNIYRGRDNNSPNPPLHSGSIVPSQSDRPPLQGQSIVPSNTPPAQQPPLQQPTRDATPAPSQGPSKYHGRLFDDIDRSGDATRSDSQRGGDSRGSTWRGSDQPQQQQQPQPQRQPQPQQEQQPPTGGATRNPPSGGGNPGAGQGGGGGGREPGSSGSRR